MYFKQKIVAYKVVPYITIGILLVLDIILRKEIYFYLFDISKINIEDIYYIYIIFFLNIIFGLISIIRIVLSKKYANFEKDLKSGVIPTQEYLGAITKVEKILSGDKHNLVVRFFIIVNINIDGKEKKYKSDWYNSGLPHIEFEKKLNNLVKIGDKIRVFVNRKNINEYYIEDLSEKFKPLKGKIGTGKIFGRILGETLHKELNGRT